MAAKKVIKAFHEGLKKKEKHDETYEGKYFYRGNKICWKEGNDTYIDSCGWMTNTTKDRLNSLGFRVIQKKGQWYLNGKEWNGQKIKIENIPLPNNEILEEWANKILNESKELFDKQTREEFLKYVIYGNTNV